MKKSAQEKRVRRRSILMLISAWILSVVFIIFGIIIGDHLAGAYDSTLKALLIVSCIIPVLLLPLSIFLKKKYVSKWNDMQVSELQQCLLSQRQEAAVASAKGMKAVKRLQLISDVYAVMFSLLAIIMDCCTGALFGTNVSVPLCFYAGFLFLASFSRIRFPLEKTYFQEDETYVEANDYPELYRIAYKAQAALNCSGEIKISLLAECNAGIMKIGDTYSVQLGVILLNVASPNELYAILLHEFAHMSLEDSYSSKQSIYNNWICTGGNPHFLSGLTSSLFCYLDTVYQFQYTLHMYSVSVIMEENADLAMAKCGDKAIAASVLLKLKYYQLFEWEEQAADSESLYQPEQPATDMIQQQINRFTQRISERAEKWNELARAEIISRRASHPTLKMRLETLGVNDYRILEPDSTVAYTNDTRKALEYVDAMLCQKGQSSYPEERVNFYLNPKEKIDSWESQGKPISATEYADIDAALRQLGRMTESEDLCDRAIAELSDSAACYARYIKGVRLLHKYDPSGLDLIYTAMENNSNYIDEGLNQIGSFCCLTGRQEDLDCYRQKSVEFAQKQKDEYSEISVLKKNDNLSTENLPQELLNGILACVASHDNGFINRIYLVRKTISDDFFTSAVVVCFIDETSEEDKMNFLHQMFSYLDTCASWQFSLFDFSEVDKIRFEAIPNSCIYSKQ